MTSDNNSFMCPLRERFSAVSSRFDGVVVHSDLKIARERRLAIERWVKTYFWQVENVEGDRIKFLHKVFRDEDSWLGSKLNNAVLGEKLTVRQIEGMDNPLNRYHMACRYCVIDKIYYLHRELFGIRNKYLDEKVMACMAIVDPVYMFWIDKDTGDLIEYRNAAGFRKAVAIGWNEGIEHFYGLMNEKERKEGIMNAAYEVSVNKAECDRSYILNFCLCLMDDVQKYELFLKLLDVDQGVHMLFHLLMVGVFLDTLQEMVRRWCYDTSIPAIRILSHLGFSSLIGEISDLITLKPEFADQARSIAQDVWKCERFSEHKKVSLTPNKYTRPWLSREMMESLFARLSISDDPDCLAAPFPSAPYDFKRMSDDDDDVDDEE